MTILPLSDITPKTHKLRTLKEAFTSGYKIPETYIIIPPTQGDLNFLNSLQDCTWLIRPSIKESKAGLYGAICRRDEIEDRVDDVLKHYNEEVDLILQVYIQSDLAGIMLSSDEVCIESVCGSGYGLTRGGIRPSTYKIKGNEVYTNVILQKKKYQMVKGRVTESQCNEFSDIPKKILNELIEMSDDFKEKIIDWCSKDEELYFLEYWPFIKKSDKMVQGTITNVNSNGEYDILVIPNADIKFYERALKSNGVISRIGGYLSHLAVICYEKNIPFIISNEEYKDGEVVFLDRDEKKVFRIGEAI